MDNSKYQYLFSLAYCNCALLIARYLMKKQYTIN